MNRIPPPLISLAPPAEFDPQVHISACYLEIDGKILLLERAPEALEGSTWGVPAGKIEQGETPKEAAIRELFEETSIAASVDQVEYVGTLYIRKKHMDYVYHMFKIHLKNIPQVILNAEHTRFLWIDCSEIAQLPLISGAEQSLRLYQELLIKK